MGWDWVGAGVVEVEDVLMLCTLPGVRAGLGYHSFRASNLEV